VTSSRFLFFIESLAVRLRQLKDGSLTHRNRGSSFKRVRFKPEITLQSNPEGDNYSPQQEVNPMKQIIRFIPMALVALTGNLFADDAERLSGKWSMKKINEEGQSYTQTVEIKKDKFIFQILSGDDNVVIYAEGDFKIEKLGPFNSARFFHVRGGQSSADLQDVDDEYTSLYVIEGDTWMLASNFDKDRNQKPSLDVYRRVKATAQAATLVIDEIEMSDTPQSATWYLCFEVNVSGSKGRHYIENKGYDKNQITIPLALELKAKPGQK